MIGTDFLFAFLIAVAVFGSLVVIVWLCALAIAYGEVQVERTSQDWYPHDDSPYDWEVHGE